MMRRWKRFRRNETDIREEIALHLELRAELNRQAGLPPDEACHAARRQFGNATLIGEEMRSIHVNTFFESLGQDLRYALRGFLRNPIFTLTAVLAAALGIGSSTAVFSVVDRILFRSLPYPNDDRLVSVGMIAPLDTNEFLFPDAYFDWRRLQTPFESITSFTAGVVDCDLTEANPARLGCARVESNFLSTFGLTPILGRNFTTEDDRANSSKVALMSYGLWQSRFGRDQNIAGKVILLDAQPVTIVGVLPASFEMPTLASADLLIPQALNEATERNGRALRLFARLKPGITVAQARDAMQPLFRQTLQSIPAAFRKDVRLEIRSLRDRQIQDARTASWVLLASVIAVLLIACANIANLLLARSTSRQRELTIRAALGASRGRLVRQTLTETMLLGLIGGVFGCALAWTLLQVFIRIAPNGIPRLNEASLDGRVLFFACIGSLISGLLFGLAPAIKCPRRTLLREALVAAQIAVSLVLLTGAGMLLRSLWKLQSVPLGMETEHVVTAEFVLGKQRYSQDVRQLQFYGDLENRLRQMPGATAFVITDSLPPGGGRGRPLAALQAEGQPLFQEGTGGMVTWRYVTPGYFATLGIPIVRGRGFREEDRAPAEHAIILSESLARKLFPNGDAVGKHVKADGWSTVAGVTRDVRNLGPMRPADMEYYVLRKRTPDEVFRNQMPPSGWRDGKVAVRTSANPQVMADWLKREFAAIDPALPITLGSMRQRMDRLVQRPRFNALLLSLFAGMGVLLAAVGLYGVMAFLVGQRTQEIGVRMALGATPGRIAKLVLARALLWTLAGATAGAIGSLFAARALRTMLFQVPQQDAWTLSVALPALLLIALAAAWIPSRRAARVDPMMALRQD